MSTTAKIFAVLVLLTLPLVSGCCTVAGGALGGGTGAVIGSGVGLCCGDPAGGMKNGAAIGAGTGVIVGAACDAVILSPFAIVSHVLGCDKSHEAMTADELEKLQEAGVDEQVIITQIEQVGMDGPLSVKEIVRLQEKGVSQAVIEMAQRYPGPRTPSMMDPASGSNTNGSQLAEAESKSAQAIPTETPPTDSSVHPSAVIKASATEPVPTTPARSSGPVDSEAFRLFEATPSQQHHESPAGWSTAP